METIQWFNEVVGVHTKELLPRQMAVRAVIVFFAALILIRTAGLRSISKLSSFDYITALMLGAILGRSIVANSSFGGSLLAALVITLLHRLIAWITFKSRMAGKILKGEPVLLFRDGELQHENLSLSRITEADLHLIVRQELHTADLSNVKEIYLERSGEFSIIKNEKQE